MLGFTYFAIDAVGIFLLYVIVKDIKAEFHK